jgi:hypothetical protein
MGMLTLRVSQAFAWASGAYQKKKLSSCGTITYKQRITENQIGGNECSYKCDNESTTTLKQKFDEPAKIQMRFCTEILISNPRNGSLIQHVLLL